ncbi:hypothetical protein ThrDRAFT_02556 [Frankia casuarinae]|uniref:hypothetical protein n=1 Tax=unclassified Frankia TaxID=2632575 RepID=UPI0002F1E821|nr:MULTISPECIES: hypothetical protein [Frankia]KFB04226.1 hypothetical protein ALLO2DRAFT_02997 [Frankia sp. Allo2]OFB41096.1 hypothetical protein Manayef4_17945 [Frankia sp. CgIM4]OHV53683.1 hypothetical protein CgIS1_13720 [Frankia sp. CgIS1]ETA02021.1 hypothetical protein CcI6DRAFT_02544 [Frankia sp. CcI6]EYT91791.1 hypothetical protein ThrDRAFT_02556 [Frankia casuarinae]
MLEAGVDVVEEAVAVPPDEVEDDESELTELLVLPPDVASLLPPVAVASPTSLGRCCVDPPEELDRLSFL